MNRDAAVSAKPNPLRDSYATMADADASSAQVQKKVLRGSEKVKVLVQESLPTAVQACLHSSHEFVQSALASNVFARIRP